MAFESLTERLNGVFKKLRGKGKLNEADIKAAMREVRMHAHMWRNVEHLAAGERPDNIVNGL